MRPILRVMDERTCEINALFIQPTKWCANQCKGCYVKGYHSAELQVSIDELTELFSWFYHGEKGCWANQITISMDRLPHNNAAKRNFMHTMFTNPVKAAMYDKRRKSDRPELHMTFHGIDEFLQYNQIWSTHSNEQVANAISMISLSTVPIAHLAIVRNLIAHGANINYNHMIPADITTKNVDTYIDKMMQIGEVVNSIYIIIFKENMGRKLPMGNHADAAKWKMRRKSRLSHELAVINTLRSRLPKYVWQKVRVDGCLQDSTKYLRTGESCSSNVSRFQVWPDGSVTGCPYAISSDGAYGRTASDILANIRRARGKNEFERRCYIPKILDSLPRRPKSSKV